jgi:hypothetical protein
LVRRSEGYFLVIKNFSSQKIIHINKKARRKFPSCFLFYISFKIISAFRHLSDLVRLDVAAVVVAEPDLRCAVAVVYVHCLLRHFYDHLHFDFHLFDFVSPVAANVDSFAAHFAGDHYSADDNRHCDFHLQAPAVVNDDPLFLHYYYFLVSVRAMENNHCAFLVAQFC